MTEQAVVVERFWSKVNKGGPADCWPWTGPLHKGYGSFRSRVVNSGPFRSARVHRIAYELVKGEIPEGLVIDHMCRNRACCNPAHLRACTNRENILAGISPSANRARQTHCKRGHEFNEDSTGYEKNGCRYCRVCNRERNQRARGKPAGNRVGVRVGTSEGKAVFAVGYCDDGLTPFVHPVPCLDCGKFVARDGHIEIEHFEMSSEIASIEGICGRCIKLSAKYRAAKPSQEGGEGR